MAIGALSKKPEIRSTQEIETILLPILKKSEYFKGQQIKESDLIEIASLLRYEFHPKDSIISDLRNHKYSLKNY